MKLFLLLLLAQAPETPAVEPWPGTLAEGLAEVERLGASGATAEGLALAERLLAPTRAARWREEATKKPGWRRTLVEAASPLLGAFGIAGLSDAERATIHHARGVLLARATDGSRPAAVEAFERARALAGPGDLRLDATYDAGWTWLAEGEAHRAKIPEIAGTAPAPAQPPSADPPAPDPIALARTAYLQARARFVDRIAISASDEDTRANLELVQRRLRELDEIEKKREEQKKEQEQPKDEPPKDPQDQEQQEDPEKDSESKQDQQPPPDEKKPEEPPKDPNEEQPSEPKDPKQEKKNPSKEELLTREEVMRLLDILKEREEEGKKLQEQLRASRRVAVKKDW